MFNNILAEMSRHGMTRQDVADLLGISTVTLGYKLSGKRSFLLEEIYKLAVKFNVSLDYLAVKTENPDTAA